jgi:hypothetical protein
LVITILHSAWQVGGNLTTTGTLSINGGSFTVGGVIETGSFYLGQRVSMMTFRTMTLNGGKLVSGILPPSAQVTQEKSTV